jgi:translation initiation factor 2D
LQALKTTLSNLPTSAFPMPTTTLYTAHILPARPFTQTVTTPVDIKHSTFKSLSAFLRTTEKGGLLKLKDARPDVVVVAVYPTHADVVAHRPHRTVGEEDERRRRREERNTQQAAAAANAEKSMAVTELWKPHLGTLPLFADLGLE